MTLTRILGALDQRLVDGGIGFIAVIVTKWHGLGIEAWLKSFRSNGHDDSGVILLRPHARFGISVLPEDLPYAAADDRVQLVQMELPRRRSVFGRYPHIGRTIRRYLWLLLQARRVAEKTEGLPRLNICSPFQPNFDILTMLDTVSLLRLYEVSFIITDEGLASYFSPRIWRHSRRAAHGATKHAAGVDRFREGLQMAKTRVEQWLLGSFDVQERFLFSIDENRSLVPNTEIVSDYRSVLESNEWRMKEMQMPRDGAKPVALFLTQAWGTNGELTEEAEISTIQTVAHRLKGTPYRLLIKPHPNDDSEKYRGVIREMPDVALMDTPVVVERILQNLKDSDCIISYNSTALLTAAVLYGIPSYTVGSDLLHEPRTGLWFKDFHREFLGLAKRIVRDFGEF